MPLPSSPYRGLLYYESDWADIFAGRSEDSKNCAERLMGAPLLILHGRTGCGKSSFLRAGLAPFLEASSYPASFMRDEKGFKVVRSGGTIKSLPIGNRHPRDRRGDGLSLHARRPWQLEEGAGTPLP
jgi:hypothetical protein